MAPAEFAGVFGAGRNRPTGSFAFVNFMVKDMFSFHTLILLGALAQILFMYALPYRLAILPAVLLVVYNISRTLLSTALSPNDIFMKDVALGRTSAQLPLDSTTSFGNQPAAKALVVFHFGVRFNHPLGVLAPGVKQTIDHFNACNDLVLTKADDYGILGTSPWRAGDRESNNTLMMMYYFKDLEGLNRFAHDDIHRKAWDWIVKTGYKHIGFFHEAFCVPAKAYESIYVNLQPMLMGATSVKSMNEDDEQVWVRSLVNAEHGSLKSQFGRMGRAFAEHT